MTHLIVSSVIFGIFYAILFWISQKSRLFKVTFAGVFIFTALMYFILTLLMNNYLKI